jgi:hypothetical protein
MDYEEGYEGYGEGYDGNDYGEGYNSTEEE